MRDENKQPCSFDDIVTSAPNALDMRKYVVQNNPSLVYGSAKAIKSVPGLGEIEWVGNNRINKKLGYIELTNYFTSDWLPDIDFRANLRDMIRIPIDLSETKRQVLLDKGAFLQTNETQTLYYRNMDDILESIWRVDSHAYSYIQINSIDSTKMVAIGEFSITLIKDPIISDTLYSNSVSFNCGTFMAKIE